MTTTIEVPTQIDVRRAMAALRVWGDFVPPGHTAAFNAWGEVRWLEVETVATPHRPLVAADGSIILGRIDHRTDFDVDDVLAGEEVVTRWRATVRLRPDGTLTASVARMSQGRATSGKTYARWWTVRWASARSRGDGSVLIRQADRLRRRTWNRSFYAGERGGSEYALLEAFGLQEPARTRAAVYPLVPADAITPRLWRGEGEVTTVLPTPLWPAFAGTTDVGQVTRALFGQRRYRKDLVRATAQIVQTPVAAPEGRYPTRLSDGWGRLAFAWAARGLVADDHLVMHLTGTGPAIAEALVNGPGLRALRTHLRALDAASVRRLLLAEPAPDGRVVARWVSDVLRAGPSPEVTRARGWGDLHDQLTAVRNAEALARRLQGDPEYAARAEAARAERARPIELDVHQARLEGTTGAGREVVLARSTQTLEEWGAHMEHCIGGYGHELRSRRSWLGAVSDPGAEHPLANFEIAVRYRPDGTVGRATLSQLLGRFNQTLAADVREDVVRHLVAAGVTVERYWGDGAGRAPHIGQA